MVLSHITFLIQSKYFLKKTDIIILKIGLYAILIMISFPYVNLLFRNTIYILHEAKLSKFNLVDSDHHNAGEQLAVEEFRQVFSFTLIGDYIYLVYKNIKQVERINKYTLEHVVNDPLVEVYSKTLESQKGNLK